MNGKMDKFLQIQNEKTRLVSTIFKKLNALGYGEDFLEIYKDTASVEQIILELNPSSPRAITTLCSLIGAYAKFIENDNAYQTLQNIDRNLLWKKAKPNAPNKYISYNSYLDVIRDIDIYEELNALHYQTLFMAIYEGIFCDDMSVIANLRGSDIRDNIVTLYPDSSSSYEIELSTGLINNLKELANSNEWERKNRYGLFNIEIYGKYNDCCFKIENREGNSNTTYTYRFAYYRRLSKIAKNYLEYKLSPSHLFISGIMHNICIKLNENKIALEDAFASENRNKKVGNIIMNELSRCNHNIPVKAFREQVIGHLDTFM